jgi:hypothetical protein
VTVAREAVAVLSDVGDPLALGDALLVLSRTAYWHGGQSEALPPANRAVDLIDGLTPAPVHAMAYAHMARLHLLANRNADAGGPTAPSTSPSGSITCRPRRARASATAPRG